jgi:processing peptidase subunit beta
MATKILSFATKALRRREAVARFAHSAAAPFSRVSQLTELGNGVRVVSEDLGGQTATIGVSIDCGSRYENEDTAGVSSLVVHSLLSQSDERALNAMGAELKARVGRDRLFLALRCLSRDVTKGIEILGQLVANPDFADVESARDRAFREMASVDANPEAVVMNGLHAMAFQNTGLALPPVGRSESLARLSRKDCENYVNLHFKGPRVVVAVAGDVDHDLWWAALSPISRSNTPLSLS